MNNDRKDEDLIEAHRIAFLKQADNKMVKYVPDTLLVIAQRAEEASEEVSNMD